MHYIISASTDIGIKKSTNQDSLTVKILDTQQGKMVFALLCDGMGGLAKGEVASSELVEAFQTWVVEELPEICDKPIEDSVIRQQWSRIAETQNNRIINYGNHCGIRLGTTVVAMLITEERYYIMNVGDSRAYELAEGIRQLTKDQTLVEREIALGNLTPEEAESDPRRSVLLQCIGASEDVYPDFFFGRTRKNAVYMLCSDGFRHEVSSYEIFEMLEPNRMLDEKTMRQNVEYLIGLNKSRMEQDNISVITIRTY